MNVGQTQLFEGAQSRSCWGQQSSHGTQSLPDQAQESKIEHTVTALEA
jgi:hypothetical protein